MTICLVVFFVAGLHFDWFVGFRQTHTGGSKSVSPLLKMVSGITMVEYRRLELISASFNKLRVRHNASEAGMELESIQALRTERNATLK